MKSCAEFETVANGYGSRGTGRTRQARVIRDHARNPFEFQGFQVRPKRDQATRRALHVHDRIRPAGNRLDAERPGSRVQVEHRHAAQVAQASEERLPNAVGGRPQPP